MDLKKYRFKTNEDEIDHDNRYPWLSPNSKLDYFREYWKDEKKLDITYNKIKTIVCIKPLVVLVANGKISNFPHSYLYTSDTSESYISIVLKNGFAYGTRMPFDPKAEWFSPDLDISPEPVEIDGNGIGHIPVPWGELVLTKLGDQWIVTANRKPHREY